MRAPRPAKPKAPITQVPPARALDALEQLERIEIGAQLHRGPLRLVGDRSIQWQLVESGGGCVGGFGESELKAVSVAIGRRGAGRCWPTKYY